MAHRTAVGQHRPRPRARAKARQGILFPVVLVVLAMAALAGAAITVLRRPALSSAGTSPPRPAVVDPGAAQAQPTAPTGLGPAAPPAAASAGQGLTAVSAADGAVRLAAADTADGRARFYTFKGERKTILFFAIKSADGVIRAGFDACDVCFSAKKGYHQEGDELVCNNCGTRFPSVKVNEVRGGCNPAPLDRQVQGDEVIIKVSDLEAGARYF